MLVVALLFLVKALGICIGALLCLYVGFRIRKCYRGWGGTRRIPGPPGLPFLGNLLTFLQHRRNTLPLFLQWTEQYGHTYKFTVLGDRDIILINDPESIKHVLSTKFREGVYGKGAYQQEQYRDLIGMGIFNSNPPLCKEQRKCAAPLFTPAALKSHGQ
jgi:cytochrome P450